MTLIVTSFAGPVLSLVPAPVTHQIDNAVVKVEPSGITNDTFELAGILNCQFGAVLGPPDAASAIFKYTTVVFALLSAVTINNVPAAPVTLFCEVLPMFKSVVSLPPNALIVLIVEVLISCKPT